MISDNVYAPTSSPSRIDFVQPGQPVEPELTLKDVLAGLYRRRRLIAGLALLGMILGLAFALAQPKQFSATATVEFAQPSTRDLGIDSSSSTPEELPTMDILNTELKTEQAEISDENTVLSVVERLHLTDSEPFAIPADLPAKHPLVRERGLPLERAPYQRERVLKLFQRNLTVDIVKGTRLLSVSYRDTDAERAARIANGVVQSYMEQATARRYTAVSQVSSWLTDQLGVLKQRVEESQHAVERYGSDNEKELAGLGLLSGGVSGKGPEAYPASDSVPVARLLALNNDLTNAQVSRLAKEAIYRVAATGDTDAVLSLGSSSLIAGAGADSALAAGNDGLTLLQHLREQGAELAVQSATAATKYGPKSAVMQEYARQHDALDTQIRTELGRIRDRAKSDLDLATRSEDALRGQVSTQQREVSRWTTKADRLLLLQGEAASNRSLYESLSAKLQESQLATGLRTSRVAFIDAASVPTTPSSPKKRVDVGGGLLLGLLLGLVAALAAEYFDSSLHTAEAVEKTLSVKVLGTVPKFAPSKASSPWVAKEPQSRVAEAYRSFRATAFQAANGTASKVVLIVSARPGEGKATTCLNSAAALAAQGHRVLIVNADLRRSHSPAAWGEPESPGLSRFLEGPAGDLQGLLAVPGVPGVSILPAGASTARAPELLGSPKFADLLQMLREDFDYILIDSPPAMLFTDARVLAACADACVLVVQASKTSKGDAQSVLDMLNTASAPLLGVLFNAAEVKAATYSKFGYQV